MVGAAVGSLFPTLLDAAGVVGDFAGMPPLMKRLALVQFFSWSALFIMWIYTTPIVARYGFGASDPASTAYQQAGNLVLAVGAMLTLRGMD